MTIMNALPSQNVHSSTRSRAAEPPRRRRQHRDRQIQHRHRRQGVESIAKIATYVVLSAVAAMSAINLVKYNLNQQSKLHQLETELKNAKERSVSVDSDFRRSFDARSSRALMQENSDKIFPELRPIVIVEPEQTIDK
jgi:microsomal dipeptidase-like Zn-dependent dipeptidase